MKTKIKQLMLVLFLTIAPAYHLLAADPDGPPGPGGSPIGGGTPVGAPVDGGMSLLLALGAGYGAYKIRGEMKKKEE